MTTSLAPGWDRRVGEDVKLTDTSEGCPQNGRILDTNWAGETQVFPTGTQKCSLGPGSLTGRADRGQGFRLIGTWRPGPPLAPYSAFLPALSSEGV